MIKRSVLSIFAAILLSPTANADEADDWIATYEAPKSLALKRVELRKTEKGELKMKAYATGYPDDVDWGEVSAQVYKDASGGSPTNFLATFTIPKAKELLIINPNSGTGKPNSGGSAMVELFTTFTDGRPPQYIRQWMQTPSK